MTPLVALCADETSLRHPGLMGLEGEHLASQTWLRLFTSGQEMRTFLKNDRAVDEAWVVSCDDIEPINLAATLKRDRSDLRVCLITFQGTGSLRSRASAAAVDVMLTSHALASRYGAFKRVRSGSVRSASDAEVSGGDPEGLFQPEEPAMPDRATALQGTHGSVVAAEAKNVEESSAATQPIVVETVAEAKHEALLLPIVSGSGGAGKSSVAAMLAVLAQRRGQKTLLLDFDLQFGDMREMLGQPDALGIDEVLDNPARLAQLSCSEGMPAVLGAPRHLEEAESIAARAPVLLDALHGMFDVIVANTGAAWAEQHAVLLERCSKALFLIDQRGSSLRACRRALDLCARCGIAVNPFLFAVNFCAKNAVLTSIDVSCALRGAETYEIADGGAEVESSFSEGRPVDLLETGNPFAQSLQQVLPALVPAILEQPDDSASLSGLGMLFRRRKRRKRGAT